MPRRQRLLSMSRSTGALVGVAAASAILYSVLVPVHAVVYEEPLPLVFILGVAVCAAPLIAITRPWIATILFCVASWMLPLLATAEGGVAGPWPWSVPALLALVLLVGTVTVRHGARLGLYALVLGLIGALTAPLLRPDIHAAGAGTADLIVTASVGAIGYTMALLAAGRLRVARELTREREQTALEQSRRALIEERTRIARELHDVIAHSMSVIQVQASTARYRLPELDATAVAEFESIAATARSSLTEMRRMLGVLRTEDQSSELAPQHGLDDIPALADSIRRAGVEVGLEISGSSGTASMATQIAAYRIVQEALSNAVRHSAGTPVAVRVQSDPVRLRVRVTNPTAAPTSAAGVGHGLRGMRERAEILGGSLTAGAQDDGTWSVTAELPLGALPDDDSQETA